MIKIDFKRLRGDYMWFGWWYRFGVINNQNVSEWNLAVHPALKSTKFKIITIEKARKLIVDWEENMWDDRQGSLNYD